MLQICVAEEITGKQQERTDRVISRFPRNNRSPEAESPIRISHKREGLAPRPRFWLHIIPRFGMARSYCTESAGKIRRVTDRRAVDRDKRT